VVVQEAIEEHPHFFVSASVVFPFLEGLHMVSFIQLHEEAANILQTAMDGPL
jgi:hypothetical protein